MVRDDHCFQRIVLDHAVGAAWRTVLTGREPAWRQASDRVLAAAVRVAEAIDADGAALLRTLNAQSLAWRDKERPSDRRSGTPPHATPSGEAPPSATPIPHGDPCP